MARSRVDRGFSEARRPRYQQNEEFGMSNHAMSLNSYSSRPPRQNPSYPQHHHNHYFGPEVNQSHCNCESDSESQYSDDSYFLNRRDRSRSAYQNMPHRRPSNANNIMAMQGHEMDGRDPIKPSRKEYSAGILFWAERIDSLIGLVEMIVSLFMGLFSFRSQPRCSPKSVHCGRKCNSCRGDGCVSQSYPPEMRESVRSNPNYDERMYMSDSEFSHNSNKPTVTLMSLNPERRSKSRPPLGRLPKNYEEDCVPEVDEMSESSYDDDIISFINHDSAPTADQVYHGRERFPTRDVLQTKRYGNSNFPRESVLPSSFPHPRETRRSSFTKQYDATFFIQH